MKSKELIGQIRCTHCNTYMRGRDWVYIDIINTITHQSCYRPPIIRDEGRLIDIISHISGELDDHDKSKIEFISSRRRS